MAKNTKKHFIAFMLVTIMTMIAISNQTKAAETNYPGAFTYHGCSAVGGTMVTLSANWATMKITATGGSYSKQFNIVSKPGGRFRADIAGFIFELLQDEQYFLMCWNESEWTSETCGNYYGWSGENTFCYIPETTCKQIEVDSGYIVYGHVDYPCGSPSAPGCLPGVDCKICGQATPVAKWCDAANLCLRNGSSAPESEHSTHCTDCTNYTSIDNWHTCEVSCGKAWWTGCDGTDPGQCMTSTDRDTAQAACSPTACSDLSLVTTQSECETTCLANWWTGCDGAQPGQCLNTTDYNTQQATCNSTVVAWRGCMGTDTLQHIDSHTDPIAHVAGCRYELPQDSTCIGYHGCDGKDMPSCPLPSLYGASRPQDILESSPFPHDACTSDPCAGFTAGSKSYCLCQGKIWWTGCDGTTAGTCVTTIPEVCTGGGTGGSGASGSTSGAGSSSGTNGTAGTGSSVGGGSSPRTQSFINRIGKFDKYKGRNRKVQ